MALAVLALLLLLVLLMWVDSLAGADGFRNRVVASGEPPVPDARINYSTAYRMLDPGKNTTDLDRDPFASGLDLGGGGPRRNGGDTPKREPPKREPRTPPRREPKTTVGTTSRPPKREPPKRTEPAEPEPKEAEVFVYRGYYQGNSEVGVMHNRTAGKSYPVRPGRKFYNLMVTEITNNSITFMSPSGRTKTLKVGEELPYTVPTP